MSSHSHYIASLCRQLAKQGKPISVAMIRSQANRTLPIPEVISVLKKWKQDPDIFSKDDESLTEQSKPQHFSLEQRVEKLESQVALLLEQISKNNT